MDVSFSGMVSFLGGLVKNKNNLKNIQNQVYDKDKQLQSNLINYIRESASFI